MIKAITNIEIREKIIELALEQRHKLYVHNTYGPDTFDCAGFVWYIYNSILNINVFEGGYGKSTTTKLMTSDYGDLKRYLELEKDKLIEIKKGDILFFHRQSKLDNEPTLLNRYPGHCGIYLGDSRFIHTTSTKGMVIINNFDKSKYWYNKLVGSKNIIDDEKVIKIKY